DLPPTIGGFMSFPSESARSLARIASVFVIVLSFLCALPLIADPCDRSGPFAPDAVGETTYVVQCGEGLHRLYSWGSTIAADVPVRRVVGADARAVAGAG